LKQRYAELVSMTAARRRLQERVLRKTNLQEEEARLARCHRRGGKKRSLPTSAQALLKTRFPIPIPYLAGNSQWKRLSQERDGCDETDSAQRERLAGLRKDQTAHRTGFA
jgi:hypothetical protein